jgi:hypothetical protein
MKSGIKAVFAAVILAVAAGASAQTKLKWAHVYENDRAVPHGGGLGGRGDQEAHQRPL